MTDADMKVYKEMLGQLTELSVRWVAAVELQAESSRRQAVALEIIASKVSRDSAKAGSNLDEIIAAHMAAKRAG